MLRNCQLYTPIFSHLFSRSLAKALSLLLNPGFDQAWSDIDSSEKLAFTGRLFVNVSEALALRLMAEAVEADRVASARPEAMDEANGGGLLSVTTPNICKLRIVFIYL